MFEFSNCPCAAIGSPAFSQAFAVAGITPPFAKIAAAFAAAPAQMSKAPGMWRFSQRKMNDDDVGAEVDDLDHGLGKEREADLEDQRLDDDRHPDDPDVSGARPGPSASVGHRGA